jgi:hypothetical protein
MIGFALFLQAAAAIPPAARQIALAVAAAPEKERADATVLGYGPNGKMTTLRKGTGIFVCLADDPAEEGYHVSCYHRDLDPFMARGRELRAAGLKPPAIDSARLAEIKSGKIKLPSQPAALFQLMAPPANVDPKTGAVKSPQAMSVVYVPYATPELTGLPLSPKGGLPWLMHPGLPWAHIMITP